MGLTLARHGWLGRLDADQYESLKKTEQLLADYDAALRGIEGEAIARINRSLDQAFLEISRRLLRIYERELNYQAEGEPVNPRSPERYGELLKQLKGLLDRLNPARRQVYLDTFMRLLQAANALGLEYGEKLAADAYVGDRFIPQTVNIPITAIREAALSARGYLDWSRDYGRESGTDLADRISGVVQKGLAAGDGPAVVARDLRKLGGVVKGRAEMVARTESLKAANTAQTKTYQANGISLGVWWATPDERTCAQCAPFMGNIYDLSAMTLDDPRGFRFTMPPVHPRCRCKLSAVTALGLALRPEQLEQYQQLNRETVGKLPGEPDDKPPPFVAAARLPMPSPAWDAASGKWLDPAYAAKFQAAVDAVGG
jgi:SPP1 gp7 family putative phage head morphogenesis protein